MQTNSLRTELSDYRSLLSDQPAHAQERKTVLNDISERLAEGVLYPFPEKNDRKSADTKNDVAEFLQAGATTAAYFLRGKVGLGATLGVSVLGQWCPQDSIENQRMDVVLGAAKGLALRTIFEGAGHIDCAIKFIPTKMNLPFRATILGSSARSIGTALSRSTWSNDGNIDLGYGCSTVLQTAFNPVSLAADVAAFGLTTGLQKGVNRMITGSIERSPLLSTTLVGTGFGFSTGATEEIIRQQTHHEQLDLARIGRRAALRAAVDSIAAVPGGMQAEREALHLYNSLGIGEPTQKVPSFRKRDVEKSEELRSAHNVCCRLEYEPSETFGLFINPGPELPLSTKTQMLTMLGKMDTHMDRIRTDWDGQRPKTFAEFTEKAVENVNVPARAYRASGQSFDIIVPEEFATRLDSVRNYRLAREAGVANTGAAPDANILNKALPEDVAHLFDCVPNNRLVRKVKLFGQPAIFDAYEGGKTMASAFQGKIEIYNQNNDSELRSTTNHEWCHLLHDARKEIFAKYKTAVSLESGLSEGAFNSRSYARRSPMENFAVHLGEDILALEPYNMMTILEHAPIRAAVLGRALKSAFTEGPQASASLYKRPYEARADFIERRVVPYAVETLKDSMFAAPEPSAAHFEMLGYLGKKSDIDTWHSLAPRVQSESTSIEFVDSAMKLLHGDQKAQADFLYKIIDMRVHPNLSKEAVDALTPSMIQSRLLQYN